MVSRTRSFPHVIIAKPVHNLCSGFSFLFHLYSGIFFVNTTRTGAKLALLRRFFYAAALTAAAACAFGDYLIT